MSDWTSGYVADIDYTFGYYNELNPNRATFAFLRAGYVPPNTGVHCELGFGQGLSVNIHAAASGSEWYATDFNPSQAAFATSLAVTSGSKVHLTDEAFVDFCNRPDLPEFDTIGLHGIWSWISDENRAVIVDFIRRKLKMGGALYISYNTLPGWSTFAPMRHLMTVHANEMGSYGKGVISRIDSALDFAQQLLDTNPKFAMANPSVVDRLKIVAEQDRHYLAHEYFNKDWHPMYFATIDQWLSPAKIGFACSANYLDFLDEVNLTPEQQTMLKGIADKSFKESVRDFMVNQQFRKDYWIKGARKLSVLEQAELIKMHKLVLTSNRENISPKITGSLGEINFVEAIYSPVLDLMADHKIRSVEEIAAYVKEKEVSFPQLVQVVMALIGMGYMASAQADDQISRSQHATSKLNNTLINKARYSRDITFLASPVTGGGIEVSEIHQLFLLAITEGKKQPQEWAQAAWVALSSQNRLVLKDGKVVETAEGNIEELKKQAIDFANKSLPILKALKIA